MFVASYKDLIVWQKSMAVVKEVYSLTEKLPKIEQYSLSNQMRRAAVSIPSNIAEGYKRKGLGEYLYFLSVADGSAAELETQLYIVKDIYPSIETQRILLLLEEVQKMLMAMIKKLNPKP